MNGWRTISLLSHRGKASDEVHLEANPAKSGPKDLRGSVWRESRARERREAVPVATEIIARFHKATKGRGKEPQSTDVPGRQYSSTCRRLSTRWIDPQPSQPCQPKHRWQDWTCTSRTFQGTYYKITDRSGQIQRQVLISKGVRQCSVEGPLIFVACYDLVLHGIQVRREAAELSFIGARSRATRSGDGVVVPANEIAFVDDLLLFLIFVSWEHLTGGSGQW